MSILVTLWWLCFWTALGLCLGSFLNAVIYRLPRGRSLLSPLWSFCPHCRYRLRWYDNLPVVSFILLRGRCRSCGIPIATRYIVVELAMALVVLMLLDAFFIGHARAGVSDSPFGLTDQLSLDWPILAAHVVLFACLLPMSVIDLEHYWVDVRFTNLATIAGFVLHALWTPRHSAEWIRPSDTTAIISVFAVVSLGIIWLVRICRVDADPDESEEPREEEDASPIPAVVSSPRRPPPSLASPSRSAGWVAGVLLVVMFFLLLADETSLAELRHTGRALLPLLLFFTLIISVSAVKRSSDSEIAEAIYEERHQARQMVLSEFMLLVPAIIAAALGWWVMTRGGDLSECISNALHGHARVWSFSMLRTWNPLYGLATAASGYIVGGAIGWAVRIVFTLVFGKEAFGIGDIHLMAAAGCVAGWPVVVLGFFLTCILAMIGWIVTLPFKRTRAVPLGPWLSLSFLAVVVFYDSMIEWPVVARAVDTVDLLFRDTPPLPMLEGLR